MILRKGIIILKNKKTPDNHCLSGYPASYIVVEATGLEPTASASRTLSGKVHLREIKSL